MTILTASYLEEEDEVKVKDAGFIVVDLFQQEYKNSGKRHRGDSLLLCKYA